MTLPPQPRADGSARVVAKRAGGRTRLADLYERGSAKIRLPRVEGDALHAVVLNTAGGVTGGDRFAYAAEAGPGARLTLATQTAERAYRAQPDETGRIAVSLSVGDGARLEWLAQETILFDRCALRRTIDVDMAEGATLLLVEPVVLGRQAMGETVQSGFFSDFQRIRRGGRLVYADATRLAGAVAAQAARPAALGPNRAWASIVYVAPDAEERLDEARSLIAGGEGGASAFDGLISARMVSSDGQELRRRLLRFLAGFRVDPPPRVWEM
ncbi:MAG: urease accessory protein UreD [Rhodobacteraceae bacterium]|nr:MAG: urease accessory protein UreD [Paracoccaceae bacterium]